MAPVLAAAPRLLTAAIAAVAWSSNRLDIFKLGAARDLQHLWLGGMSSPLFLSNSPPCHFFHSPELTALTGSSWGGWESLGGVLTTLPSVTAWAPNRLDLVGTGTDAAAYHKWWDGRQWGGWEPQGGILTSDLSITSWGPNRLDFFGTGTDHQCYHKWWDGAACELISVALKAGATDFDVGRGYEGLGGVFTSDVKSVSWSANRLDLFGLGTDSAVYHKSWNGAQWSGWEGLGGVFNSPLVAETWGPNALDVFGLGTDNGMYHKHVGFFSPHFISPF